MAMATRIQGNAHLLPILRRDFRLVRKLDDGLDSLAAFTDGRNDHLTIRGSYGSLSDFLLSCIHHAAYSTKEDVVCQGLFGPKPTD